MASPFGDRRREKLEDQVGGGGTNGVPKRVVA